MEVACFVVGPPVRSSRGLWPEMQMAKRDLIFTGQVRMIRVPRRELSRSGEQMDTWRGCLSRPEADLSTWASSWMVGSRRSKEADKDGGEAGSFRSR